MSGTCRYATNIVLPCSQLTRYDVCFGCIMSHKLQMLLFSGATFGSAARLELK